MAGFDSPPLMVTLYADSPCRDFVIQKSDILENIAEKTGCRISTTRHEEHIRSFEMILGGTEQEIENARHRIDAVNSETKQRTSCIYISNDIFKLMSSNWNKIVSSMKTRYNVVVMATKDDYKKGLLVYFVGTAEDRCDAMKSLDQQINRGQLVQSQTSVLSVARRREVIRNLNFEDYGIGGLESQLKVMIRRAFNSRTISDQLRKELGMNHTKGVLFYGPPGTGKSLVARKLSELLGCEKPKIVNSPEVESKWVGEAEKNIRALFEEAIKDWETHGTDSRLHVVIFDELDAIAKKRGGAHAKSRDGALNQMLCSLDGINEIHNLLVFGLTNRMDSLDSALLRPGRLEVQIEIGLPNAMGREEILNIHTKTMRQYNRMDADVDIPSLAAYSDGFSGADIAGFIRNAQSFALDDFEDEESCFVTQKHLERALYECRESKLRQNCNEEEQEAPGLSFG